MSHSTTRRYLEDAVRTASPQKIRLMLIEAAIRNIERTRMAWQEAESDDANSLEYLIKAQDIVTELLASLDRDTEPELASKVAGIQMFIYRCLLEAGLEHSVEKLDDAKRILEEERETWRLACEQAPTAGEIETPITIEDRAQDEIQSHHLSSAAAISPVESFEAVSGGFSIEA